MPIRRFAAFVVVCAMPCGSLAGAQSTAWRPFRDASVQDHGHQWSRVGDPHNDPFVYDDPIIFVPPRNVGRVDYKFRIMTREVTVGEWFQFVESYAPYIAPNSAGTQEFIGTNSFIQFDGFQGGVPRYHMVAQFADVPIQVGWRYAARFVNWLHNGKADAAAAFEAGAYDTSTFGQAQNPQGGNYFTDQQERSEGARFWIPSTHEWKKAGHWDPDRFGEDQGGWWLYPITSDAAPVPGDPNLGGQTNGPPFPSGQNQPFDVGSYPDVQSPWGVLDMSGGGHEWLEEFQRPEHPIQRFAAGSSIYFQPDVAISDLLTALRLWGPTSHASVRIASVIPSPGTIALIGALGCARLRRRRR